jgi:hypothetical protein
VVKLNLDFDHDNAPAHASLLIRSYLEKHPTSVVTHPPYSTKLVQQNFFLFLEIKTTLKGRRFQTIIIITPWP